jgi:hypothetical protein
VGEPSLSQAEQVSQGGEPTVDRGDPFGLLGYDCCWLKLERARLTEPRKIQLQRMRVYTDQLSTHSTAVCHKTLYLNAHNTAP